MVVSQTQREERKFWVITDAGIVSEEIGLKTDAPDYWWFPRLGQPGWGTSMMVGYGCYETRELALESALRSAEKSLKFVQERIAKIKRQIEDGP